MIAVFGPVPSRRLGRSLGINHLPSHVCSYSCAYCQIGPTLVRASEPEPRYAPELILEQVRDRLATLRRRGERVDYVTFVPEGEPCLDRNLGASIDAVRTLGVPVAVITNGSLLWRPEVRERLLKADCVSIKVDAASPDVWRRINRPHRDLSLEAILEGVRAFAAGFRGRLLTETMLVRGVNDDADELARLATFLGSLHPAVAYVSVPTRPPASAWALPPDESGVNRAVQILGTGVGRVEYLIGYEGTAFTGSGDAERDLLAITAVHPMREDAVQELLTRDGADRGTVERLVADGRLVRTGYGGTWFYLRPITTASRA
jgi:wyosine [tRNA(Phe)-imidazoG37] synthetase (radical SAM superfamily)